MGLLRLALRRGARTIGGVMPHVEFSGHDGTPDCGAELHREKRMGSVNMAVQWKHL